MDYIRSCYITKARLYPDSDEEVRMVWFFANKFAKVYPEYHRFGSGNWASEKADWNGPGEVLGAKRAYWKGVRPGGKVGADFHGPEAGFRGELPKDNAAGLMLGIDGSPICGPIDKGGLKLGGKSTMFLRPSPWWLRRPCTTYTVWPRRILFRTDSNGFHHTKVYLEYDGSVDMWVGTGTYTVSNPFFPDIDGCSDTIDVRVSGICLATVEARTPQQGDWVGLWNLDPVFPWLGGSGRVQGTQGGPAGITTCSDPFPVRLISPFVLIGQYPPIISTGDPALGGTSVMRGTYTRSATGGTAMGGYGVLSAITRTIPSSGDPALGGSSVITWINPPIDSLAGLALGGAGELTFHRSTAVGILDHGGTATIAANLPAFISRSGLALGGAASCTLRRHFIPSGGNGLALGGTATTES